jgi:hypothetical protein
MGYSLRRSVRGLHAGLHGDETQARSCRWIIHRTKRSTGWLHGGEDLRDLVGLACITRNWVAAPSNFCRSPAGMILQRLGVCGDRRADESTGDRRLSG